MAISIECGSCHRRFRAKDQHHGKQVNCPVCRQLLVIDGTRVPDHDVFVSHSAKDKALADALVSELELARIRCWIAPRDVPPGATWGSAIVEAIENSRVMVLIYSSHSNASRQVLREIERAVAKGVVVLPVRIDTASMSKDLEYFLSACHWLDALTPPLEEHLRQLAGVIRRLVQERGPAELVTPVPGDQNPVPTLDPRFQHVADAGETSSEPSGPDVRNVPVKLRRLLLGSVGLGLVLLLLSGAAIAWSRFVRNQGLTSQEQDNLTGVASVRAIALTAWERVRNIEGGETLGTDIDEGIDLQRTAQTLYDAGQWPEAAAAYKKLQQVAERIEQANRERAAESAELDAWVESLERKLGVKKTVHKKKSKSANPRSGE